MPVPTYDFPCLVQSATAKTFYLIGSVQDGRLDFNSVDLTDINNPSSQPITFNADDHWSATAAKLCFNYAGVDSAGVAVPLRTHIQQFSPQKTFDVNALTSGNSVTFQNSTHGERTVSFPSIKQFAIVGRTGSTLYGSGETTTLGGSWIGLAVNSPAADIAWKMSGSPLYDYLNGVSLVVGTFNTEPTPPVNGNIIAFGADGTSGQIFTTTGLNDNTILVTDPQSIQMGNITLSKDAIPVHMDTTAFILDKAKNDGSVTIYTITPGTPTALTLIRVAPSSSVPLFTNSMVGSATASQIVIYSLQKGNPVFNSFDRTTLIWSGPGLTPQSLPTPGDGNGGNNDGGAGTDSGNGSSGTSNAAVIGGAVAGVLILALIAAFFIVRRKRQRRGRGRISQKHHLAGGQGQGGGSGGSSDLGAEEREENKPVLSDYQQQQNRASLQMAESSRGSIVTLNSSSTAPLVYAPHRSSTRPTAHFLGQSQPGQPTSAPLTVPQQLQLQQHQIQQQQQQQQQQSRRGVSQGMEVLSLPAILEQHPFEQQSEGDDEELRKLEQESPFVARPYSNVPAFSYPSVYQDQPRHQHLPVRTTVINPYSGASVVDDEEQEPYVLPDPIIVAPTPVPHKAELLD
ncbi:hypothetical protein EC957_000235 [Mortierella hygrophila]|uniref:Uncharacterized protein n=1 Tax=Mortierella hygrophila TaxID=979708 RepID=A0A9P6K7X9_9FUNG|nr:hypothetical protein EC957_000235 [Mortierella hygrophila]